MSRSEVPFWSKKTTRRGFLGFSAATIYAARNGIVIPMTEPAPLKIHEKLPLNEIPSYFDPMIIAHRCNSPEEIYTAANQGATHAEIDLNEVGGNTYGDHGVNIKVGPAIIGIDTKPYRIRAGPPENTFDLLLGTADRVGINIYADVKRGNIDENDVKLKYQLATSLGVKIAFHSADIKDADNALRGVRQANIEMRASQKDNDLLLPNPEDIVAWVPGNSDSWDEILENQEKFKRKIVHTDATSAYNRMPKLLNRGMKVIIGDIQNMDHAVELCKSGLVVGLFNDISNLRVLLPDKIYKR